MLQANSILKFNYVMIIIYLLLALMFWIANDNDHTLMFMVGSIIWIVSSLVWTRNMNNGD